MLVQLKNILGRLRLNSWKIEKLCRLNVGTSQCLEPLKYTVGSSILTKEQRNFYEENGFLVIRQLVSEQNIQKYRERFVKICKGEINVPGLIMMKDIAITKSEYVPGKKAIAKIQYFQQDKDLYDYCTLPEILDYIEDFIGGNINVIHTMFINKPPDEGKKTSRHPLHQDLHYYPIRPAEKIVGAWTAMQTVNRENGCLAVLPGTHKGELLQHEYPEWEGGVNMLFHGVTDYDSSTPLTYVEMALGDTVFFHPLLIHGSGMNRTTEFRKCIFTQYASSDIIFTIDEIQKKVAAEFNAIYAAKQGIRPDQNNSEEIWKHKFRTVRGKTGW